MDKTKCRKLEKKDDYSSMADVSNPYYYNFGKSLPKSSSNYFSKLHYKDNISSFNKK